MWLMCPKTRNHMKDSCDLDNFFRWSVSTGSYCWHLFMVQKLCWGLGFTLPPNKVPSILQNLRHIQPPISTAFKVWKQKTMELP